MPDPVAPTARNRGADALMAALKRAGTSRIFTLSGNHIMPVFDAAFDAGIELVHTRHEAAAVHMADAHARLTGEVGIALVTGGPGHANAVGALYTALMAESPVLLLSGHAPHGQLGMGAFQEMRQVEMAAPVCKASGLSVSASALAGEVMRALHLARAGRPGPVHLSLPTDVLDADCGDGIAQGLSQAACNPPPPLSLRPPAAQVVMARLLAAQRPMILCGPALLTRSGRALMARLEAAVGIPVIGMESPRGINDPALGAFGQMLAQADEILLLGKRLDFTLKFGEQPALAADARFTQIDPDPAELERARRALGDRLMLAIQADTASALSDLAATGQASSQGAWRDEVHAALRFRPPAWDAAAFSYPGRLHPVQALRPLQQLLDAHPDAVLVSDGGEFGQWAQACLSAPHRVINGVAGAIGAGLPFAIAARLALPDAPVIAFMGDGSFGFHVAEFDTAARHLAPFVAVVGNDARWNAEYQIQLRDYGASRTHACELYPSRYDQVAAGFGAHPEYVTQAAHLLTAVKRARDSGKPACVNVMIEGLPAPNIRR